MRIGFCSALYNFEAVYLSHNAVLNYNKIYLALATVVGLNLYFNFLPVPLRFETGAALLLAAALAYGAKTSPTASILEKISFGILLGAVGVSIVGSVFFYAFSLGKFAVLFILFFIFLKTKNAEIGVPKLNLFTAAYRSLPAILYAAFAALLVFLAAQSRNSGAVIKSPWLELPILFLPLFFIGTLCLILLNKKIVQCAFAAHFFLFFCLAAFFYGFGYGFDQFVHEAAQKYIIEHGTITPKPTQYIGLYSINIFLRHTTGLSINLLDSALVPLLTIILAPTILRFLGNKGAENLSILGILFLPLSSFVVSTPQGLANLLLLIFIFLGLNGYKKFAAPLSILLIHPLAGVIAFIYLALIKFKRSKKLIAMGIVALPLAFAFLSYRLGGHQLFILDVSGALRDYWSFLTFGGLKQNYNIWLDAIYLVQYLLLPAIIITAICIARIYKKEISQYPLCLFGITTASSFITRIFVDFSYLINYEQKNYPERIFYISFLFLAPYLLFAVSRIASFVRERGFFVHRVFFACLFAFFITANLYLTYPRWDNYQNDKGKNVTSFIIEATAKIKQDAGDKSYVVLADQAVSAAALRADGFKKYYKMPLGEVFYYPIPTGGPLYNEFLNLVYNNAGEKAAANAKNLTGAEIAYIALPSYWENYERIKENLKIKMDIVFEDKNIIILRSN